jgi:branched-chain amino acid transport system ATP-binding protein
VTDAKGLCVCGLAAGYGRVKVVSDFTVTVAPGEVVALVGRNGAGKSTALAAVAGLRFGQAAGRVTVDGAEVSHESANAIVVAGVSLVPEGRRIFRDMTVLENLRLGAFTRRRAETYRATLNRSTSCSPYCPAAARKSPVRSVVASNRWWPLVRPS